MTREHAPAAATPRSARFASHSLEYVRPSQPHTGSPVAGHVAGTEMQLGAPKQSPDGVAQTVPEPHPAVQDGAVNVSRGASNTSSPARGSKPIRPHAETAISTTTRFTKR
jgi:hypothetical protein